MDLILNQSKSIKMKLQMVGFITIISFLTGLINIKEISLVFVLPFFYLSFMCGYYSIGGFFVGLAISTLMTLNPINLIVCALCFLVLHFSMLFKSMNSQYVPYMLTLIAGINYAYMQMDIYSTLLFVVLTFINMYIYLRLVPLFIHGNSELLTHERLKSLGVLLLACTLSIMPYSSMMMQIMMRIILLVYIYYECIEDILPGIFYISLYILLESMTYQKDILCMLLPIAFFFMIKVKHKVTVVSLYVIAHIMIPFITDFTYDYYGVIITASALLFLAIPIYKYKPLSIDNDITLKQQLSKQVDSFCRLFEQITNLFNQVPPHNHSLEYIGYIYEDMCQNCSSEDTCFNKKYGPNRLIKLMNKGLKESYDETDHKFINEYCLKSKQYKEIIKKYKNDYKKIQRVQLEYQTMKKEIYNQFSILNDVFHQFSSKLSQGNIEEKHIYHHMIGHQFNITHLKKYYESQSVYYIEIGLQQITKDEIINDFIPILETYINETLDIETLKTPMKKLGYTYLVLSHKTRYSTQYGITQCSKDKKLCGDSYEVFSMHEHQYFTLSDGMGQGEKANQDSLLTLDVFKQLIVNGISLKDTIQSINALLKIKNRNDMFTTLDICEINQTTGLLKIIKYGACPTYILRNHEVLELSCQSLPVGIVSPLDISAIKYQLKENDIIFMITDGFQISFKQFLEENKMIVDNEHPKDIAHMFMSMIADEEKNDDMTLITIKLCAQ